MNNLNQHVPKVVGLVGVIFLVYSMYTFFRPLPQYKPATPPPKLTAPVAVAPPVRKTPAYKGKTWNQQETPAVTQRQEEMRKAAQKAQADTRVAVAKNYLAGSGLKLALPEDDTFIEANNEGMRILMGLKNGKPDFYLISGRGKMTPERARLEMQDQFGGMGLDKIKQDTLQSRNLGPTTQFKGVTNDGQEFQAVFFYNSSSGNSHMLFVVDKELSRQPARTRQLFDSLDYDR